MQSLARKKYFVYVLSMAQSGAYPFYVGKGSNQRPHDHARDARGFYLSLKCAVIRYLFAANSTYWIRIAHETNDEDEAYWLEMKEITSYPPKALCNVYSSHRAPSYRMSVERDNLPGLWRGELKDPGSKIILETFGSTRSGTLREVTEHHDNLVLPPYLESIKFPGIKSLKKLSRKAGTDH